MMLADPRRVHPERFRELCLFVDLDYRLPGRARVVRIAVVTEREVAEFHRRLPRSGKVALDIAERAVEIGQDFRTEAHHPGRAVLEAQRAESDDEFAQVV